MLKNSVQLEVKKNEKTFTFQCEPNSHYGEIHDALYDMLVYVITKINENAPKKKEEECCPNGECCPDGECSEE